MLYQEMNVFTRSKKVLCISVYSVFTWKEKSQGISVDSTNNGNNCTTKKVNWKQTERQTDLLYEFLQRNTDLNYTLLTPLTISPPSDLVTVTVTVRRSQSSNKTGKYLGFSLPSRNRGKSPLQVNVYLDLVLSCKTAYLLVGDNNMG